MAGLYPAIDCFPSAQGSGSHTLLPPKTDGDARIKPGTMAELDNRRCTSAGVAAEAQWPIESFFSSQWMS